MNIAIRRAMFFEHLIRKKRHREVRRGKKGRKGKWLANGNA